MGLESLLKPVKWADEQILRQYTKLGKRFHLEEGRKRYVLGMGLWFTHVFLAEFSEGHVMGGNFYPIRLVYDLPDGSFNMGGILGGDLNDGATSEAQAIHPLHHFYRKFNSATRLPTLLVGVGLIGKFGADFYNLIQNAQPMENSYNYLTYGLGWLSLSSSMYLKAIDPKLLDKKPFWKTTYEKLKEKAKSLVPEPTLQPMPVSNYATLDSYVKEIGK